MLKSSCLALVAVALLVATADARPCYKCQPCPNCTAAPSSVVVPSTAALQPTLAPNTTAQRSGSYDPALAPAMNSAPVYRYRTGRSFNDSFKASRKILGY